MLTKGCETMPISLILHGGPDSYTEFVRTYTIPPNVQVRTGPTHRNDIIYREGQLTLYTRRDRWRSHLISANSSQTDQSFSMVDVTLSIFCSK